MHKKKKKTETPRKYISSSYGVGRIPYIRMSIYRDYKVSR